MWTSTNIYISNMAFSDMVKLLIKSQGQNTLIIQTILPTMRASDCDDGCKTYSDRDDSDNDVNVCILP